MGRRLLTWGACGALIAGSIVTVLLSLSRPTKVVTAPALSCPTKIDLGCHEAGQVATAEFEISNSGGTPLWVGDVRTSCACIGLERRQDDGTFHRVSECWLNAGESGAFAVRFTVRGVPGREHVDRIEFRTNDPTRSEYQVELFVPTVLGLRAEPNAVVFGKRFLGSTGVQTVELYNLGSAAEKVVGTSCTGRVFSCTFTPTERSSGGRDTDGPDPVKGVHLGTVRVTFAADSQGHWESDLKVTLRRENQDREVIVPISAKVVAAASLAPDRVRLPRLSDGARTYRARCLCVAEDGRPCVVAVESSPEGITTTEVGPEKKSVTHVIEVSAAEDLKPGTYVVKLKVVGADATTLLELPIDIRRED